MSEISQTLVVAGLGNGGAALLIIVLSIPLARRKVGMNRWYGVRLPKAFLSDENWFRYNEIGGRVLIGWFFPVLLLGLSAALLGWRGIEARWAISLSVGSVIVATVGAVTHIMIAGRALPGKVGGRARRE